MYVNFTDQQCHSWQRVPTPLAHYSLKTSYIAKLESIMIEVESFDNLRNVMRYNKKLRDMSNLQ